MKFGMGGGAEKTEKCVGGGRGARSVGGEGRVVRGGGGASSSVEGEKRVVWASCRQNVATLAGLRVTKKKIVRKFFESKSHDLHHNTGLEP